MNSPTNFNQPNQPGNLGPNPNDSQKRLTTIMGIAIALLLGLSVFLLVRSYRTGQQLDATSMELTDQKTAFSDLETRYNDAVTQLEQQKGINSELDAKINEQLAQLETQKNEVANLISQNKDYRAAMAKFERQKNSYLAEIQQLKTQNAQLTESNTQLSSENQNLNSSLTETQARLEEESTAKAALISEKSQLETERTQLAQKVDIASAIRVRNITVKPVSVRSSGKEKSANKAKNVEKLNICFTTEPNEVVPSGNETFFIRVVDPTGAPLAIESLGSGVAQDKRNAQDFRFTTTATTNYTNGEQEVCGSWQPGQDFAKGNYKIEVYNKGFLVGSTAFKLK